MNRNSTYFCGAFATCAVYLSCISSWAQIQESAVSIDDLAPYATSLSLVEVLNVRHVDLRNQPFIDRLSIKVGLKTLKSSGRVWDELESVKEAFGKKVPSTKVLRELEKLNIGEKYWIVFTANSFGEVLHGERRNGPGRLYRIWPTTDPKIEKACLDAISNDHYEGMRFHDAGTGVTFTCKNGKSGDQWSLLAVKDGKALWKKDFDGLYFGRVTQSRVRISENGIKGIPKTFPAGGWILIVEYRTELSDENEFRLKKGLWDFQVLYDPITGVRRASFIGLKDGWNGGVISREYSPQGVLVRQRSIDRSNGTSVLVEDSYDEKGSVVGTNKFLYGPSPDGQGNDWQKIENDR